MTWGNRERKPAGRQLLREHPTRSPPCGLRIADNNRVTHHWFAPTNCTNQHNACTDPISTWGNAGPPSIRAQPVPSMTSWSPLNVCGLRIADNAESTNNGWTPRVCKTRRHHHRLNAPTSTNTPRPDDFYKAHPRAEETTRLGHTPTPHCGQQLRHQQWVQGNQIPQAGFGQKESRGRSDSGSDAGGRASVSLENARAPRASSWTARQARPSCGRARAWTTVPGGSTSGRKPQLPHRACPRRWAWG